MSRYLVVANQTLQAPELRDELRKRIGTGSSSFYVLVPNTGAGLYRWGATAQARHRLNQLLADLTALGVPVEGDLGSSRPLEAMEEVFTDHQFDEIIVATLPQRVSRWLGTDLPHQAERRFKLPVTTIVTR
jgi:hypothetical protein